MIKVSEILDVIREELRKLRLFYKELIERLIPIEKLELDERKAIEEETVYEKELFRAMSN